VVLGPQIHAYKKPVQSLLSKAIAYMEFLLLIKIANGRTALAKIIRLFAQILKVKLNVLTLAQEWIVFG